MNDTQRLMVLLDCILATFELAAYEGCGRTEHLISMGDEMISWAKTLAELSGEADVKISKPLIMSL